MESSLLARRGSGAESHARADGLRAGGVLTWSTACRLWRSIHCTDPCRAGPAIHTSSLALAAHTVRAPVVSSPQWLAQTVAQAVPEVAGLRSSGWRGGRGEASPGLLGAVLPQAEGGAFLVAGKGWARPTSEGRRARRRTLPSRVRAADGSDGISHVTRSRGSPDAPDSPGPIPDFGSSGPSKP